MAVLGMPGTAVDKRYYGVATGTVEQVEGDPEKECRVRLRLPWFDDSTITDWCRVAQSYAGRGYGACFVPEVGDEVLIAFFQGDMRYPIVVGSLYNGKDKPPTHRERDRDEKLVRTKHGHTLVLDDSPGRESVRLASAAGHRIELDDAGRAVTVRTASGGKVTVTADGSVEISAGSGPVTVRAASVTVDAAQVNLGTGASLSPVVWEKLGPWLSTHVHPSAAGPTSPPTPPLPVPPVSSSVRLAP
ncbi:phage baseplate assembly protein V [Streptomyces sp. HUAS 31]|uniref:phage baseplate assembly protein V n=1 Tax=Streptomyces TaxID=1883 RepID=UPI0023066BBA|nr:phage baseplate assembly protein V [Streptomyces sp. HUAS 31]WCE01894.1 phage baseplate assembly protein V [Streptomyces sp. HUAS 31]